MKPADKYIKVKKEKKKMQQGGQVPPAKPIMEDRKDSEEGYEVTIEDDSGLIKYKFSKSLTI